MNLALTQRVDFIEDRQEFRDSLDQRLTSMISKLGFSPILVPNCLTKIELTAWLNTFDIQGIVFSGGNDIGEFSGRDNTEKTIYDFAKDHSLPIFGICRGMQFINIMHGGTLHQIEGHSGTYHRVTDCASQEVHIRNSYHNFSIKTLGSGLQATFISEEGQIEGVKHKKFNHCGIMWHPEREPEVHSFDAQLFLETFKL